MIDEHILQFIGQRNPRLKELLLDRLDRMTADDIYVLNGLLGLLTQTAKEGDALSDAQRALFERSSLLRGKIEAIEKTLSENKMSVRRTDIDNTDWA